ncbi:MAG: hypothetical protein HOF74_07290 [Gammaproteobacteria bacterium]|nr:hypothetical protein [Gammaproteobacteria bacterium]MBT3859616.1 hypothetical protein [Gammaproteobacteria bacterium]MBT3986490.1 hypothetical protein [Gammaproteobacteria bacterium]MBT4255960.1 hypothetical protein [Gammaproteobacteria bacterium]MBT4582177.1 hypothetical protein [Gammaproteobacteria bacterium]
MIEFLLNFSQSTGIFTFMNSQWGWPVVESFHFLGLSMLIGTVGVFDLRLLGVGKEIEMASLHKLVPFGVAGFFLNVITGTMFLSSAPDQYIYNPAIQSKLFFLLLAGINMLVFYNTVAAEAKSTPMASNAPTRARIIGGVSLLCWCAVIVCGRLITYYRPPYHWCLWC